MKRLILNKWFILAILLMMSFFAFSYSAYKKTRTLSAAPKGDTKPMGDPTKNGIFLWNFISRPFFVISL